MIVTDFIQNGEGSLLEFKSTLRVNIKANNVVDKKIEHSALKTIAAFLNSEGGMLLIGVEDNKSVLGLELDFNSFTKGDKFDEFQKYLDNLIGKSFGNHIQSYLKIEFPRVDGKIICSVTIKEKSADPIYITDETGQELFYIRRQASSIALKPSEAVKYIQQHWKQSTSKQTANIVVNIDDMYRSKDAFNKALVHILSDKDSVYYQEIKGHWNSYSLIDDQPSLNKIMEESLPKSIEYGLLLIISDYVRRHLYNDREAKYLYNQSHIYVHNQEEQGYDLPVYYHIRFIGILYATTIHNKVDIDTVSRTYKNMQSIYSGMIEGMVSNLTVTEVVYEKEYATNYHWLIGEIFSTMNNWLRTFNEEENFVETSSYRDFIPFCMSLCLSELCKGLTAGKISVKFIVRQYYYGVLSEYLSPLLNDSLRDSIETNIIAHIPNELIEPILDFSLNESHAIWFYGFSKGDFGLMGSDKKNVLARLRNYLIANNKI